MADSTTPPPPMTGGGNLKYAIIGGVLIVAAIVLWLLMRGCDSGTPDTQEHPTAAPDAGAIDRTDQLTDDDLVIPELEPDAGPVPDGGGPRIRYVTRYVGGGGSFNCSGNISAQTAARVVQENNLQFRNCYERRLKVNNHLEGHVMVAMRVARNGTVDAVQVSGSLGDREVFSCIRTIANRLHFPVPQGGACAVVQAPFNFTPQH